MFTVVVEGQSGTEATLEGKPDQTLMQIIRAAGFDEMLALCGGCLACATCHVVVDEPFYSALPEISTFERDLLEYTGRRQANSRLSCQLVFAAELDGMKVTIMPD